MEPTTIAAVASVTAGLGMGTVGAWRGVADRRQHSAATYLEEVLDTEDADPVADRFAPSFHDRIVRPTAARAAALMSSVTPRDHRARIDDRLRRAGLDTSVRPDEVIAAQGVGLVVGLLAGAALLSTGRLGPVTGLALLALLVLAGAAAPMAWLRRRIDERATGLRRELAETLDLLAISVEAGLGLEGAMAVVVDEGSGPLATELARTIQEMELGVSRRDALTHLRHRCQVTEVSTFVQALIQADLLGMPLTRVLKIQADEMRTKRRQWARERAGKLPVKIMFPLVACIFPAILVVILGPAMTQIGQAF